MKRKKRKIFWILLLILLILGWIYFFSRPQTAEPEEQTEPAAYAALSGVQDHLLVDFHNHATTGQIAALMKKYGLRLKLNSRYSWTERLYRSAARRPDALLSRLRKEPLVERAELDLQYSIPPLEAEMIRSSGGPLPSKKSFPNDPQYRYQWHLDQIGMPKAWPGATGRGVVVAVIDTGVAYKSQGRFKRVPDLAQTRFVPGYDFVNNNETPLDDHGHGTHVAGTIAQSTNNGEGVAGTAYRARIMPIKVLSAKGFGSVGDIAEAIRFAADHGAQVINMSLGGARSSKILGAAVKYAHKKGVVVVCAAGNNGRGNVSYPAAYPGAVAVAATQFDRATTFYSNWGKEIDLAAPGGNTRVDQNGDGRPDGVLQNTILPGHPGESGYLLFMGTSMAAPHVAGAVALVMERGLTEPAAVERVLKATARHPQDKRWDPHYGAGIIDVNAALSKTTTAWGGYKLGLSALLGLLMVMRLRSRQRLGISQGLGALAGLVVGSSGLFLLSSLGLSARLPAALDTVLTHGFPAWDMVLSGPGGHGNPLFYSALVPLLLTGLLYGVRRLRGLLCGFLLGVAGHLLLAALLDTADIFWIPNVLWLDQIWLVLNSLVCLTLAAVVARK